MALSTKSGKPIAVVAGGDDDGMKVFLAPAPKTTKTALTAAQKALVAASLKKDGFDPETSEPARLIERALAGEHCNSIRAPASGTFSIFPSATPDRIFVGGPSGCGKSSVTAQYVREWVDEHPNQKVYLFSTHDGEKAYAELPMIQIELDDEFLEDPPTLEELKGSLLVFDDVDQLQNRQLQKAVSAVIADVLANGRKYDIWVVSLAHMMCNGHQTRLQILESTRIVIFPGGAASYHNERLLRTYCGLSKKNIAAVLSSPSRWVCISRTAPMYILTEDECYLLQ